MQLTEDAVAAGWATLIEACRRLRMTRERVMRRIEMGELEAERHAGRWVVSVQSIDAFIREHEGRALGAA